MQTGFISYNASRIHYLRWGQGDKVLVCLHGYGESAGSFALLEPVLGEAYTIVAPDMPWHGETEWNEGLYMAPAVLVEIVKEIVAKEGLGRRWALMGYSMGGRIALSLLQHASEHISGLVLLAPDGMKVNPWYWLATQTSVGNRLFRYTMDHPRWFMTMLKLGNSLRVVNKSVYKFTSHYIGDREIRHALYTRWTTMRGFRPRLHQVQENVRSQGILIRILYGRYDRIITSPAGEKFCRGLDAHCRVEILSCGHRLLERHNLSAIAAAVGESC